MIVRLSKVGLTLSLAVFALLVGIDNIIDYGTNFAFVQHVLSMDTTFPNNKLMWRAITSDWVHHAAYWLIIASELAVGVLCLGGRLALVCGAASAGAGVQRRQGAGDRRARGRICALFLWFPRRRWRVVSDVAVSDLERADWRLPVCRLVRFDSGLRCNGGC